MYLCNPLHYLSSAYKKTVKNPRPSHFTVLFLCHFLCMLNKNEYRTHRRFDFSTFLSRWQEILLKRLPFSRTGVIFSSSFSFVCLSQMTFGKIMKKLYAKKETICSVVQKILSGVTHSLIASFRQKYVVNQAELC